MPAITTLTYAGAFTDDTIGQLNTNLKNINTTLGAATTAAPTGTGSVVLSTSATLTTPTLTTPTLTNPTITGATTVGTGGITPITAFKHTYAGGVAPVATTSGTDSAAANGKLYISEIFVPANFTATGIAFNLGSVGGTDKVVVILFDSTGAVVANSALDSSVTAGTTATFQLVPFTATYAVKGPGQYFVGVVFNGNTAKIRTHAAGAHVTQTASQTFNTPVAITPATTFTADVGPYATLY